MEEKYVAVEPFFDLRYQRIEEGEVLTDPVSISERRTIFLDSQNRNLVLNDTCIRICLKKKS